MNTNLTILKRMDGWIARAGMSCRSSAAWLPAIALVFSASSALAVKVVDVRVGQHAKYTRVVFELDDATGYQIERSENARGKELVISLDARTQPAKFAFEKGFVESVSVEQKGNRAVARVRLRKAGLGLKEMTLAEPARLVVDVLATTGTPTPPVAEVKRPEPKATKPEPPAKPKPAPKLAANPKPEPTAKPPVSPPVKADSPPPAPVPEPPAKSKPAAEPKTPVAKPTPPMPEVPRVRRSQAEKLAVVEELPILETARDPELPQSEDSSSGGFAWWVAGVGAFLLIGAGIAVQRRRGHARIDEDVFPDPFPPVEPEASSAAADSVSEIAETEESEAAPSAEAPRELDPPVLPELDEWTLVSGDSIESVDESAQEVSEVPEVKQPEGIPYPDLSPILKEIENRVAMLEGRIDEVVAEREAAEKQMAAHTEELRVQRAAIARTQRAVRNLSRPEDAGTPEPKSPPDSDRLPE